MAAVRQSRTLPLTFRLLSMKQTPLLVLIKPNKHPLLINREPNTPVVYGSQGGVGGGVNSGVGTATAVVGVMVAVAARGVVSVWRCGEGSGGDVDGEGGVRWWQWGEGGAWGEWREGSDRSGDGESFWVRRKKPARKVFRRRPEVAAVVAGRR
nr:hypothetical protein [Tanacetum cinerariifolium]